MDSSSRQNLTRLLKQADQKPVCVFTDLDKTSCLEGNAAYAAQNKEETEMPACYMQPDIRRALTDLPKSGSAFYIVTGRHWADVRVNDVTGEKVPDGAFYDLLGGVKDFENASSVEIETDKDKVSTRTGTIVIDRAYFNYPIQVNNKFIKSINSHIFSIEKEKKK